MRNLFLNFQLNSVERFLAIAWNLSPEATSKFLTAVKMQNQHQLFEKNTVWYEMLQLQTCGEFNKQERNGAKIVLGG